MANKENTVVVRVHLEQLRLVDMFTMEPAPSNGWRRVTRSSVIRWAIAYLMNDLMTGKVPFTTQFYECEECGLVTNDPAAESWNTRSTDGRTKMILCDDCRRLE